MSHDSERLLLYQLKRQNPYSVFRGFPDAEYGFFLFGYAAENGIKSGSLLVSLAIRTNTADSTIKRQGFGFFHFLFFIFCRPLSASSVILSLRHTGRTGG